MNYEKLRTFIIVAEKKSFSEAARVLYLSQPTITSHIKSLEEHLHTSLFERSTKQVELTQAAKVLYQYAKEIIKLIENAEKEITSLSDKVYGELNVACSLTIGENILPQILGAFKNDYPMIQISVDITNTNKILTNIKDRKYDLGLIEAPVEDPDLVLDPFLEDELVLIAKPGYFDKGKISINIQELKSFPLILREKGSGTRTVMNQYLLKAGINPEELQVHLELGSTEAVKSAVEVGLGISILSKSAIKKELKLGLLQTMPLKDLTLTRYFYIVYHRDSILKSTVDVFLQEIKKINNSIFLLL
ncbi:selenium metabolism-associated LysR family transcriptional regulator [Bacillus sp. AK128]